MHIVKRILCGLLLAAVAVTASQPIQLTAILNLTETGVSTGLSVSGLYVPMTGSRYTQGVMNVPTTSTGTAIPAGGLANFGYCLFQNLDATNYATLLTATGPGTAILRLMPGDAQLFRLDPSITAPALLAHTAALNVQYLCTEN